MEKDNPFGPNAHKSDYTIELENKCEYGQLASGEYQQLGYMWGHFFTTLRISLGDFDFDAMTLMTS